MKSYGLLPDETLNLNNSKKIYAKAGLVKLSENKIIELSGRIAKDAESISLNKQLEYYLGDRHCYEAEIQKFIKEDDSADIEIELCDLKTILDDVVIGDYAEFHAEETYEDLFGGYAVTIDRFISNCVLSKITEFTQKAFLNSSAKKSYKPIEISEDGLELVEYLSVGCTATDGEWHVDSEIKINKNCFVIVDNNKNKEFWDGRIRSKKKPLCLKIRNICGDETVWEV